MAPVIDNYQFPSFIDTFPIFMNYAAFRQGFPMELKDLETFRLIATLGNVSQAAERLGQSQPALTKCVRRLEAEFGSKLFRRRGRQLELTETGRALLSGATRIAQTVEEARREVIDLETGKAGTVRLGIGAPVLDLVLPTALSTVLKDAPGASFELSIGAGDVLHTALERGEIDMRIGPIPEAPEPGFEYHYLSDEETVIAARHGHALTRRNITLKDLAGAGWVLPRATVGSRIWLQALFDDAGLPPPRIVIETNLIHVQPGLIAATDLLTVMACRSLERRDIKRQLVRLPLPRSVVLRRRFGICWRKDAYLPQTAHKLIAALVQHEKRAD